MEKIEILLFCPKCQKRNRISLTPESRNKPLCGNCRAYLLEYTIINGYIYVLSNPLMPDILKIGFTRRTVEERVSELNMATGVPGPFAIEAVFASQSPELDEQKIHSELNEYRVVNKEFFEIDLQGALSTIERILNRTPSFVQTVSVSKN